MIIGVPVSDEVRCQTFKDIPSVVSIRRSSCSNSIFTGVLEYVLVGLIAYDWSPISKVKIRSIILFILKHILHCLLDITILLGVHLTEVERHIEKEIASENILISVFHIICSYYSVHVPGLVKYI